MPIRALSTTALVTLADAESWVEIPEGADRDRVIMLINGVSSLIERFTNRIFVPRELTLKIDGSGENELWLPLAPIVSLTTVKVRDEFDMVKTDILLDEEAGIIYHPVRLFTDGWRNIEVKAIFGYGTVLIPAVPQDVQDACLDTLAFYYKREFVEWTAELKQALIGVPASAFPVTALKTLLLYRRIPM